MLGMAEEPAPESRARSESTASPPSGSAGVPQPHDRYFRASLQGVEEQIALIGALFPTLAPLLEVDEVSPLMAPSSTTT